MEYTTAQIFSMLQERAKKTKKILLPTDMAVHLAPWARKKTEHFLVITLDGAHSVIRVRSVTSGLLNHTLVHPREVFRPAIRDNADSIIIGHNHPSGILIFSPEDTEITNRLKTAAVIIGIPLLDHILIGRTGYLSALETGIL